MIILDDLSPFFLNGDGRSLSRMQNCGGSWLEKIGRVVGVPKLTVTHLRRAAENLIQKSQDLRDRSKSLNAHENDVGRIIYDKEVIRGEFVNKMEYEENDSEKNTKSENDNEYENPP